ncbi:MAG TPA: sulfotransferase [Dokdonella sp.]|uniref:tetratricopeptide repeat-containing sulfotransferase family protein n=1 Tax=Dokdonella sp. TaxID=2291710 RepID=UPI002CDA63A1|nr:sulfotransferase [Dokdonella sp.]HOX71173.1 sulfotransferase [Dokdonella sp.]HPG93157.1 sulfotransferase [Dokdonella sp.]HPN78749.1 sulfotransferase [Dokdonella sp.]
MNALQFATVIDRLRQQMQGAGAATLIDRLANGSAAESDWSAAAEVLLRSDPSAAAVLLDVAVQRWPQAASLHYLLGNALRMSARPLDAEASLRRAIALDPAHADASISLAHLLREQGRMRALAEVMLALSANEPDTLENASRTLAFLCECERYVEAGSLTGAMLGAYPHDANLLRRAGEIALVLGRFDEAQEHLRASLAIDANQASAWLRLAHTHRFVAGDDRDLLLLRAAAARTDLGADAQSAIGFGLGKALDDLGHVAEAVEVLKRANAGWHRTHPWDRAAWQRFVDARRHAPALPRSRAFGETIPVFIVGLPRSGTTLIESLLARDAQVRSRGELNWIAALARQLGPRPSEAMLAAAGNFLLTQLRQDDAPARCIIDKNPLNFRHLDVIDAILPQARIIHCRRDLRDTALSLWSQHFAHEDMAWSYDFADIGEYARGEAALMAHWESRLAAPILHLDYEALVSEPETTIATARAFLGLEPAAQTPSQGETTAIATASVWQARQEVHSRSVGRWQRYADHLPELRALGTD